jgi:hypothetical protein
MENSILNEFLDCEHWNSSLRWWLILGVREGSPREKSLYLPQMSADSSVYLLIRIFCIGNSLEMTKNRN